MNSVEVSTKSFQRNGISRFLKAREVAVLIALVLLVAITVWKNPAFLMSRDGWRDLLVTPSILILVALGQAIVVITRNIDLSVGAILGLSAYGTGQLLILLPDLPLVVTFVAGALGGALLGCINGVIVAFFRVPALVVTLGTMYVFRGIDILWAGGDRIFASDLPSSLLNFGTGQIIGIPFITILTAVVLIAVAWFMKNKRAGRELYAVGSDPEAAVLYGLPVKARVLGAFIMCGALSGLAGVLYLARYATADSQAGSGLELQAVAAVVIGGIAIFGGSGSVWGAAIGAILLLTINRALPVLGVPDFWQGAVVGVLIIGAIVLDRLLYLRRAKALLTVRNEHV